MRILFAVVCLFALSQSTYASDPICDKIRAVSVTVHNAKGVPYGSGTLFTKGDEVFCLTAEHVVTTEKQFNLSQLRTKPCGTETVTTFRAKAIAVWKEEDVAILSLGKLSDMPSVVFSKSLPDIDDPVIHCGSWAGLQCFRHSISKGFITALGRFEAEQVFDIGDFTMFGGSSGGGVFNKDGELIGVLVRGMGDRAAAFVPLRRITGFIEKHSKGCCDACPRDKCKCGKPGCDCGCNEGKGCNCNSGGCIRHDPSLNRGKQEARMESGERVRNERAGR